ncbi:hypothetical protein GCM10022419_045330 [Nonomuraea rosea]|uniref:Uncharacterized protein n=1 Tax=Nonomuraea rosea TaxID=638574 RepID=A0ABP6X500_9ACTN
MAGRSTAPSLAQACQTCEGRKLLQRTETRKRWFITWKVQRFWLCRTCDGIGTTGSSVPAHQEVENMAGKHRKGPLDKKACTWCAGRGGFQVKAVYLRCGRCNGSGKR